MAFKQKGKNKTACGGNPGDQESAKHLEAVMACTVSDKTDSRAVFNGRTESSGCGIAVRRKTKAGSEFLPNDTANGDNSHFRSIRASCGLCRSDVFVSFSDYSSGTQLGIFFCTCGRTWFLLYAERSCSIGSAGGLYDSAGRFGNAIAAASGPGRFSGSHCGFTAFR